MIEATVTLNLRRMLLTDAGLTHVEKHMEREFSKENLTFWQACRSFRLSDERLAAGELLMAHYVRAGSEEEVNLPDAIRKSLVANFDALDGAEPAETFFAAAEEEIFKLMERDAFARFKGNSEAVGAVVDEFFTKADISHDGYISFDEYRTWVQQQPQVIFFFSQLAQSILALLKTATIVSPAISPVAAKGEPAVTLRSSNQSHTSEIELDLPPAPDGPAPIPPTKTLGVDVRIS